MPKPMIKVSLNFTQWELEDMMDKIQDAEEGEQVKVRTYVVVDNKAQKVLLKVTVGEDI